MEQLNLDKIDLYIKKDKIKKLKKLGFKECWEVSLTGTPLHGYRYDLDEPTYIFVNDYGMLDICTDIESIEDDDYCDDDVFGVAKVVFELTRLGFLENKTQK